MIIPSQVFKVSSLAAKENKSRYSYDLGLIGGVNVERKDGRCVATTTDGRCLITASWDDTEPAKAYPDATPAVADFHAIIGTKAWETAGKSIPKLASFPDKHKYCDLDEAGANGTVKMTTLTSIQGVKGRIKQEFEEPTLEGRFPRYEDVIPNATIGRDHVAIGVNPKLLAETLKAVEAVACDEESRGVRLIIPINPNRAMMIDASANDVDATAVLMPINHRDIAYDGTDAISQASRMMNILKAMASCGLTESMDKDKRPLVQELAADIRTIVRDEARCLSPHWPSGLYSARRTRRIQHNPRVKNEEKMKQSVAISFSDAYNRIDADSDDNAMELLDVIDDAYEAIDEAIGDLDQETEAETYDNKLAALWEKQAEWERAKLTELEGTWWRVTWADDIITPRYNSDATFHGPYASAEECEADIVYTT